MAKTVKTREVVESVKKNNSAVNVGGRVKNIGVKSKEEVRENINQNLEYDSPQQYSADKIQEGIRNGIEGTAATAENAVKKGVRTATRKVKEKVDEKRAAKGDFQVSETSTELVVSESQTPTEKGRVDTKQKAIKGKEQKLLEEKSSSGKTKEDALKQEKVSDKKQEDVKGKSKKKITQTKETSKAKATEKVKVKEATSKELSVKEEKVEKRADNKQKEKALPKSRKAELTEKPTEEVTKPKPKQREKAPPKTKGNKTVKKSHADKQRVKVLKPADSKVKQTAKSTKNTRQTIKTAEQTMKNTQKSAKAAKKSAEATAKATRQATRTAKATAKTAVKTAKVAVKAIVAAGKATVAAVKSIGGIIAAGGVPAVIVIVIICLLAAIGGTCFGIFLSNDETTGSEMTMTQAISQLSSEHYANINAVKGSYEYDELQVQSLTGTTSVNWREVLAVYAVKTTTKDDNPLEVVTIDDEKLELLREIMEDMNQISGVVTTKVVPKTVVTTDEEGRNVVTTVYETKKVLTVIIKCLSVNEIVEQYNFNDEQKAMLEELMSDEYSDIWSELLGASGEIIQSGSSFVGTGMFAWPFQETQTITSYFGTRVDPISGVVKTHGGTDIAAPLGTPILAAADGVVVTASYDWNGYGFYVKIKHDDTYSTLYGHCSALHVTEGQTVKKGQVIADCGSTGYSTGPHLHFEMIQNGVRVDALMFYKSE